MQARGHTDFVCRMKEFLRRSEFIQRTVEAISSQFSLETVSVNFEDMGVPSAVDFSHSTRLLTEQEIKEACAAPLQNTSYNYKLGDVETGKVIGSS